LANSLPFPDRFDQGSPKVQIQVEPFVSCAMPKSDAVGGRGEFGGEDFQSAIGLGNGRVLVIHRRVPCGLAATPF
jgi:hypothetical protein